ncbi:MAG: metallophosphoesterase [Spirochaetales bacterium]|nr:metallophosphoesterase [Spirochaetales bacterium]
MKILCFTDIHGSSKKLPLVLSKEHDIDLIILAGDITQLGGYKEAGKILEPVLESFIKILAVHGNMDREGVLDYLEEKNLSIHGRSVCEKGITFLGLGGSNPCPFPTPHEYTDAEADQILQKALSGITGSNVRIFVTHMPPVNTMLDVVQNGTHVGSGLVRKIIIDYHIDLCLCGHIHEAAGTDKIDECICFNPGAFRDGHYGVVDIKDKTINVRRRMI